MVYNLDKGYWLRRAQANCLLCGLSCSTEKEDAIFGLCPSCDEALPRLNLAASCDVCRQPLATEQATALRCGRCIQHRPYYQQSCSALHYEAEVLSLIDALKRQYDKAIARLLGECFLQQLASMEEVDQLLAQIDVLIPCPMYWQRDLKRGLNHSLLLSHYLAKRLKLAHSQQLLVRPRYSATQRGLNAKQRQQNIKGVFAVKQPVTGLNIAIVDDVMTTGSTLNEAAKTLLAAGAQNVYAWSIARTPAFKSH